MRTIEGRGWSKKHNRTVGEMPASPASPAAPVLITAPAAVLAAVSKLASVLATDGRHRADGGGDRTAGHHRVVIGDRGDGGGRLVAGGGERTGGREILGTDPSLGAAGNNVLAARTTLVREET